MKQVPGRSEFERLFALYEKWYGALDHSLFDEVGASVRSHGFYTLPELCQVNSWKVGSSRNDGRIIRNKGRVEAITGEAMKPGIPDSVRLNWLWKLEGVSTPIASALLSVWNPVDYPVIDWVVWDVCRELLKGTMTYDSAKSFGQFADFCRRQRDLLGPPWTARRVEQALYALGDGLD